MIEYERKRRKTYQVQMMWSHCRRLYLRRCPVPIWWVLVAVVVGVGVVVVILASWPSLCLLPSLLLPVSTP